MIQNINSNRRTFLTTITAGITASAILTPFRLGAKVTDTADRVVRRGLGEIFSSVPCPWTVENPRHQQVFPLNDGRLLLVWSEYYIKRFSWVKRTTYSGRGSTDDTPCRISARISDDGGRSWGAKLVLQENVWGRNVKHPNFFRTRAGDLLFLFTSWEENIHVRRVMMKRSGDEGETWSEPEQISKPGGFYPINADHITEHSSGRIILPVFWSPEIWSDNEHFMAFCMYSDDDGETWQESRNRMDLSRRGAEEPTIAERSDGALVCMLRTSLGKVYQAISNDRGETWSEPYPTELDSPSSATILKRIPGSDDLIFLWNHSIPEALRNPENSDSFHYPRNPLKSAISKDGGQTWNNIKTLVDRKGYVSAYPSIQFVDNEALVSYYHASESASRDCEVHLKIFERDWFYE